MSAQLLVLILLLSVAWAAVVLWVWPAKAPLSRRVDPFVRVGFARPTSALLSEGDDAASAYSAYSAVFAPILERIARALGRLVGVGDDQQLSRRLAAARMFAVDGVPRAAHVAQFRRRQLAETLLIPGVIILPLLAFGMPLPFVAVVGLGAAVTGAVRLRLELDRRITRRGQQLAAEVPTVNKILAMALQAGGNAQSAIGHVVRRGDGVMVDELAGVLRSTRAGATLERALRDAADETVDDAARRTYQQLQVARSRGEQGLSRALLDIVVDQQETDADERERLAAKRATAGLLPLLVCYLPALLLFILVPMLAQFISALN